jgi:hypothetical protein
VWRTKNLIVHTQCWNFTPYHIYAAHIQYVCSHEHAWARAHIWFGLAALFMITCVHMILTCCTVAQDSRRKPIHNISWAFIQKHVKSWTVVSDVKSWTVVRDVKYTHYMCLFTTFFCVFRNMDSCKWLVAVMCFDMLCMHACICEFDSCV